MNYTLSVGAVFKNEAPYLKEWIEHYLARGVDHLYLINDFSDDNFIDVLKPYEKHITLFHNKHSEIIRYKQDACYNRFILPILNQTKYILICDIDEYVWSPAALNLKDILNEFEKMNIKAYGIDMILFGSNNYTDQPKSIVNSFNRRQKVPFYYKDRNGKEKILTENKKTICLSSIIKKISLHQPHYNENSMVRTEEDRIDLNKRLLRLNHYRFQSKEKWLKRIKLPDATGVIPKPAFISPNMPLDYKIDPNNFLYYRNEEMFDIANQCQNEIEDLDLIKQNIKYNLINI
jgi:hypothetical protein